MQVNIKYFIVCVLFWLIDFKIIYIQYRAAWQINFFLIIKKKKKKEEKNYFNGFLHSLAKFSPKTIPHHFSQLHTYPFTL